MDRLQLDRADGVAVVTLSRPDRANAIDLTLAVELAEITACIADDPSVRAVLLCSDGPIFCAGGDVARFPLDDLAQHLRAVTDPLHAAIARIARLDVPVVAAVQGAAAGAGFGLVLACDLVLAAPEARFVMAYTKVGLTPDAGTSYLLTKRVGELRALELTLTNRVLSASAALDWGIVTRLVPAGELRSEADALARSLAAGPRQAMGDAKRLLRAGGALEAHLATEADTLAAAGRTGDAAEGIVAFREKRSPRFA